MTSSVVSQQNYSNLLGQIQLGHPVLRLCSIPDSGGALGGRKWGGSWSGLLSFHRLSLHLTLRRVLPSLIVLWRPRPTDNAHCLGKEEDESYVQTCGTMRRRSESNLECEPQQTTQFPGEIKLSQPNHLCNSW